MWCKKIWMGKKTTSTHNFTEWSFWVVSSKNISPSTNNITIEVNFGKLYCVPMTISVSSSIGNCSLQSDRLFLRKLVSLKKSWSLQNKAPLKNCRKISLILIIFVWASGILSVSRQCFPFWGFIGRGIGTRQYSTFLYRSWKLHLFSS